jgi:anti-sigma factor RsiW
MNCHSAQRLLSAERDGQLPPGECTGLAAHVAGCAECRQFEAALRDAGEELKTAAGRVSVPDEERAWHDIRRELRAPAAASRAWWQLGRWALPLGAAAALAAVAVIGPSWTDEEGPQLVARAEFVEVAGDAASMVYVDDKSGWLVVWASAEPGGKGE